jgi:hypothetical protein
MLDMLHCSSLGQALGIANVFYSTPYVLRNTDRGVKGKRKFTQDARFGETLPLASHH